MSGVLIGMLNRFEVYSAKYFFFLAKDKSYNKSPNGRKYTAFFFSLCSQGPLNSLSQIPVLLLQ